MKKLVTHINPHLDDIVAMWLFVRFHPEWKEAELIFKAKGGEHETLEGEAADSSADTIYLGTGMGQFDEHKGDINDCTTTLVWKWMLENKIAPQDKIEQKALDLLTNYTFLEDTAKLETADNHSFMLAQVIDGHLKLSGDSVKTTLYAFEVLDGVLAIQRNEAEGQIAWEDHIEFDTIWGKAASIKSKSKSASRIAYKNGMILTVSENTEKGYKVFGAQSSSDVDFTEAYEKLKSIDPDSDWYLHHSKRLLICGSDVAENKHLSKLSLEQLVELIKN